MCRFAAYLGEPLPLSAMLYDAARSLERQAYLPREMVSGHVNVDGTGLAWWRAGEPEPLRYVSELPPWSDANLPLLARRLTGSPILAVVRSRTPGMPSGAAAVHPFVHEHWAGAHNGYLTGFETLRWSLIDAVDDQVLQGLDVLTDSSVLFLLSASFLRRGASLVEAARMTVREATRVAREAEEQASLNLLLSDGAEVVAVRAARGMEANSLYHLEAGRGWPSGRLIASEPLDDDPGWSAVPADHLVNITAEGLRVLPLAL
jgi:glutamine amidotransferase